MRTSSPTLLALSLLALAPRFSAVEASPPPAVLTAPDEEFDPADWDEVLTKELPDGLVRLSPGQGAMGTSATGVRLGKVPGTLLVDRRYGDQVSILLGLATPEKYAEDAHEDLRVRFRDVDGAEHLTAKFAGGGYGIQFVSPQDVDITTLSEFTLLVRKKAKWLKGK